MNQLKNVCFSVYLSSCCDFLCPGEWSRVLQVIKAYSDGEYDFGIDHNTVKTVTGLNAEESKDLMNVLSKSDDSGM